MIAADDCYTYQIDFSKATKVNSFMASGRVIMIHKKEHTGKAIKIYIAYDRDSKVQLSQHWIKDDLVKYIQEQDLSVLGVTQGSLF